MEIIAKGRGQGKTTRLIRMAASGGYIVVPNMQQAAHVAALAKSMGAKINFPITWEEIQRHLYGQGVQKLYLDNIDLYLAWKLRPINLLPVAATVTYESKLGYICAACRAPAECDLVDIDNGATLTCDKCGGKTVVTLHTAEGYTPKGKEE